MKKKLTELTEKEFNTLKGGGMLWEFYPEAPDYYDEIKRKKLNDLTKKEFNTLKATGMLWEFYPEAPFSYDDIKKMTNKSYSPFEDSMEYHGSFK